MYFYNGIGAFDYSNCKVFYHVLVRYVLSEMQGLHIVTINGERVVTCLGQTFTHFSLNGFILQLIDKNTLLR